MAIIPDLVDEVSVSHVADPAHHDSDASSHLYTDSFIDDDGDGDDDDGGGGDGDSASNSSMLFSSYNTIISHASYDIGVNDDGAVDPPSINNGMIYRQPEYNHNSTTLMLDQLLQVQRLEEGAADNHNMATDHHNTTSTSCQQHEITNINPANRGPPDHQATDYLLRNTTQFRCKKKKKKKIKSRPIRSIFRDFNAIHAAGNENRGLDSTATPGIQSILKRLRLLRRWLIRSRSGYRKELDQVSETGSDQYIVRSTTDMYIREYLADIRWGIEGNLKERIGKQNTSDNLDQYHTDHNAASVHEIEQLPMVHVSFTPCGELRLHVRCAKRDGLITGLILVLESDLDLLLDHMNVASHGELIELEACTTDSEDALAIGEETIREAILATIRRSAGILE